MEQVIQHQPYVSSFIGRFIKTNDGWESFKESQSSLTPGGGLTSTCGDLVSDLARIFVFCGAIITCYYFYPFSFLVINEKRHNYRP